MESCVEKLEGLAHKLTIEIGAEKIDRAVAKRLQELRPRVRIDGFRRGKVPPHLLKQRYGASTRQDVLGKEIDEAYRKAMENSDYAPVAQPEIKLISGGEEGEALKFAAVFEVLPEIQVKGLDALAVTLPKTEITAQDIDTMIASLRRQEATFHASEEAARENDRVTVDFVGEIDGKSFAGSNGDNISILLGEGQFLPDFEENLKSVKSGEKKSFDTPFPKDYLDDALAGKTAHFTVHVKQVERMHLPELDAAFIEKFTIAGGDIAALRKSIYENMARELEKANRRIRRRRLLDAIWQHNSDQVVPQALLSREIDRMIEEISPNKQITGEKERYLKLQQLFAPTAKRRLQLSLLLGKLFEERNIELDRDRVNARLDSIASTYEDPVQFKNKYYNDRQARIDLESTILEEQLIDQLYATATVSEEVKTFQEVMAIERQVRH